MGRGREDAKYLDTRNAECVFIKLFLGVLTKQSLADMTLGRGQLLKEFRSASFPQKVIDFVGSDIPGQHRVPNRGRAVG